MLTCKSLVIAVCSGVRPIEPSGSWLFWKCLQGQQFTCTYGLTMQR